MDRNDDSNQVRPLNKQQKKIAVFFAIFSIVIVILMLAQIRHNIRSPFAAPTTFLNYADKLNSSSTDEVDLRQKDTDNDGLSDYDESYVYNTSLYLEDSDSDGFGDKQEILNNTDPNCESGKTCATVLRSSDSTMGSSLVVSSTDATANDSGSSEEAALQSVLSGSSDTSVLRKLLLDNGMDKETLDAMSDEELSTVYDQTLNQ